MNFTILVALSTAFVLAIVVAAFFDSVARLKAVDRIVETLRMTFVDT